MTNSTQKRREEKRREEKRRGGEMAHAARLNLRMQKEVTLLVTDPPPGVSLCNDLSSSSSSSLSSIDAVIKGPEGTVYANGLFKINIQIPDRYPFQPPNVTFATPIYHPNIDNGGRICLDILNLPPKGAWQPSLNISTVLMSIGLLLGEPNPDDGLMCEASREYKYNRQTFDQKARSVTEKYANSGISVSITSSGGTPANQNLLMIEAEKHSLEPRNIDNVCNVDQEKHNMANRKLSLEFLGALQKRNYDDKDSVAHTDKSSFLNSQSLAVNPSTFLLTPKFGVNHELPLCQDNTGKVENNSINMSPKKLSGDAQKLSLKSVGPFLKAVSNDKENVGQTSCSDKDTEIVFMNSSDSPGICTDIDQKCIQDQGGDAGSGSTNQIRKKLYGIGRKLSLHSSCSPQEGKTHEHIHSSESFSVSPRLSLMPLSDNCDGKQLHEVHCEKANEGMPNMSSKKSGIRKHSMKMSTTFKNKKDDDNNENIPPNYQLALDKASTTSSSIIVPQSGIKDAQLQHQKHNQVGISQKRPLGIGKTLLMHSPGLTRRKDGDHKANAPPVEKLSFSEYQSNDEASSKIGQLPHAGTRTEELHRYSGETAENRNIKQNEEEVALITDAVIVLDSEDSDEEVKGPTRSRLSLARKPLTGKRKVKA